jgi:hypothetical protein
MRRSRPFAPGALVLAFVACNAILGNEDHYDLAPAQTCLLPSQCPKGQVCLFKTCSPPCLADVDCAQEGARCLKTGAATACVTSTAASCSSDAGCPSGSVCRNGSCRSACSMITGCLKDQRCIDSVCVGTDPKRDPLATSGGAGGAGGAGAGAAAGESSPNGASSGAGQSGTGGKSTSSGGSNTSGGKAAATAGATSEGGESGAGGNGGSSAESCVPSGPEDCFNGRDDDCNGKLDCEDDACEEPATCLPVPAGATLGSLDPAGACSTGYSSVTLRRGLTAAPECQGCGCEPAETRCESGVYAHGAYTCPGYQYAGALYNLFSTSCDTLPADVNVHFFDVRGFTVCNPTGTATLSTPAWSETHTFCQAEKVGGGCASGSRCVPKPTGSLCAKFAGTTTCSGKYPTVTGDPFYSRYEDGRTCPACSCSFGGATCAGGVIQAWSTGDCSGPTTTTLGNGTQGDSCGLPFVPHSGKVIATATAPSCLPNTYPNGELLPVEPQTICCQ